MKKFVLGLCCGIALAMSSIAAASSEIRALLFPVTFEFNGEQKVLDSRYNVLNYGGHTYVPIRFAAENLGAGASYDAETKTVSIVSEPDRSNLLAHASWVVQYRLLRGMEQKDVKEWFGDPSFVTRIQTPAQQVWRYDLGAAEGYNYGGFGTDRAGLEEGKVQAQLLLTWNASGLLERYEYWYAPSVNGERQVRHYIVYPDGTAEGKLQ